MKGKERARKKEKARERETAQDRKGKKFRSLLKINEEIVCVKVGKKKRECVFVCVCV